MKLLFLFLLYNFSQAVFAIESVYSEILTADSKSWDGSQFNYPEGKAKLIVQKITINPDNKELILAEHCHPIPLAAYVLTGSVHVTEPSGHYHVFSAGDAFIEVVNTWHKGKFVEHTELIAFYASSEGTPLSVKKESVPMLSKNCK